MSLYNCKPDGDDYRITKFTADLEVESSYLTSEAECQCPAGSRPTCRHRQMLPMFGVKGLEALHGGWMLDWDRKVWIRALGNEEAEAEHLAQATTPEMIEDATDWVDTQQMIRASAAAHGFTMLDLADPREVHNAIADAVGEPEAKLGEIINPKTTGIPHLGGVYAKDITPEPATLPPKSDLRRI